MSKSMPPIPPEQRSDKGPGGSDALRNEGAHGKTATPDNPAKEGQQANSKINTTHQGYQQDR